MNKRVVRVWKRDRTKNWMDPVVAVECLRMRSDHHCRTPRFEILARLELGEVLETALAWFVREDMLHLIPKEEIPACRA